MNTSAADLCAVPIRTSRQLALPFPAPDALACGMPARLILLDGAIDSWLDRSAEQDTLPALGPGRILRAPATEVDAASL